MAKSNPKISSTATIKSCNIKPKCVDLRFDGLVLSPGQYEEVARFIAEKEEVKVTIELVQQRLC